LRSAGKIVSGTPICTIGVEDYYAGIQQAII